MTRSDIEQYVLTLLMCLIMIMGLFQLTKCTDKHADRVVMEKHVKNDLKGLKKVSK